MSETITTGIQGDGKATVTPMGGTPPPAVGTGNWIDSLPTELKGFAQNKQWKDPGEAIAGYQGLEKLLGKKEKLIALPESEDPKEWGEVFQKLGRPEKPEEYKLALPEGEENKQFVDWAKTTFHNLGLTRTQAEKLSTQWNEFATTAQKAQLQEMEQKGAQEEIEIKREWGAAYEQNANIAKQGAAQFGVTNEMFDKLDKVMGHKETMKLFHAIGSKIGEGKFIDGTSPKGFNGILTPEQARQRIKDLYSDSDWTKRFMEGGVKEKTEFEMLNKYLVG